MKNFILGINVREDNKRTPFFVLPDGVIRTFTEGWALLSYVLDINPSEINTKEDISACNEGVVVYRYHYIIDDNIDLTLELSSDIDLEQLEENVKRIIFAIKRDIEAKNEGIMSAIKQRLSEVGNTTVNVISI
jgi:hypothetical protein